VTDDWEEQKKDIHERRAMLDPMPVNVSVEVQT
jgi:hypothetical protein